MKQHFSKALALLLALVMVLSVFPAVSFATEEGESATVFDGLPADGAYGVIFNADGYLMGADVSGGGAPAKTAAASEDGASIPSLPNGTAVVKFIKSGSDYILQLGSKYLALNDSEELILADEIGTNDYAKWSFVADQAGAAGYYNIKNVGFKYNGSPVYLEVYGGSIKPWSYKASSASLYQFKFYACSADEDGRVGTAPVAGGLPENGTYVIYCQEAKAVFGQPTGADAAAPALLPAAAEVKNGAIAYEDVADGGMIFNVTKNGEVYTFENNGLYLAMPENTVDDNGNVGNDETLLMIEWPTDAAKQGYAQWTLTQIAGGYRMDNVNARYRTSKCCVEYFNEVFSGWTYKAATPELFAMNFYPMEDKDGTGYVVNPDVVIDACDPAIGSDCLVQLTIHDVSEPSLVAARCITTGPEGEETELPAIVPTVEVRKGSFTIPAEKLEGQVSLFIKLAVVDELGKVYGCEGTFEIRDEPLILTAFPAANSATGEEKKPEIGVTFANVKENPSFAMQLDTMTAEGIVEGDKYSFIPAFDLEDGKHSVSVTITRADGKSVTRSWNFFVGEGGETLYFGQIHAHTAEYSDGVGTLEDAYEHAQGVDDLDFIIITDHSNYFDTTSTATTSSYYDLSPLLQNAAKTTTKWEEARATAAEYNALYDDFLCVYGYEMTWSGGPGHTNTFNTYGVVSRNNKDLNNKTGYAGMHLYNDMMVNAEKGLDIEGNEAKTTRGGVEVTGVNATKNIPFDEEGNAVPVISQFNHPGKTFGNFDNYAGYSAKRDDVLNLIEVGNGEGKVGGSAYFPSYSEYDLCLSMGWHVAPTNNQDNHKGNWGDSNTCRDVILTDEFSEIGLYRALDARRVYATEDQNLRISYELIADGQSFKLGDIAPFGDDAQPETVTIKLNIQDPDRTDKIDTVEIIGEGAKTLKKIQVNAVEYAGQIVLDNTDGYYYVKVVEEDKDIAVTAPVWLKEAVPVAADLETSASVAAQGEEETITATLTNGSETEALTLTGYKVEAEGRVLEEKTGLSETVAAGSEKVLEIPFTPSVTEPAAVKSYEITVTFTVIYRDKELTYSKTIEESSYPPSMMTYIGLDKGHDNFYVSGDYAGNEGNFIQICAQRGIICQYIDKGQMTKENLAKYKAILITVPRVNEQTAPTTWTAEELDALADNAAKGGTVLNFSKSDRYDYAEMVDGKDTYAYASATLSNAVNKAVGAQTRFVRGIVVDNEMKANEAYRIYFDGWELLGDHLFTEGIYPSSNGRYQWYNGTGITSDPCLRFTDVKRNQWYHEYVDFALDYGLMGGTSTTTFEPNTALTREMFVQILWRIAGSPEATVQNPFKDVKKSHWSYKAILWAYEAGVTGGKEPDRFDRTSPVSREEMAVFLYSFARYKGMDLSAQADLSAYPDAKSVSKFARTAMKWAVASGLISGADVDGVKYLKPKDSTTRAMGATMLKAFVELSGETLPKADTAVTALVSPYESTWVSVYKNYFTGSSFEPEYDEAHTMAEKGTFALATAEKLPGGGWLVCSGATFISNYDLKYGDPANEQYENYLLVCNILDFVKNGEFSGEITPIAEVHRGEVGQEFTVEGSVTSNASDYDKDTAFFDCIYVQDETRGINCFPVSGYYFIGEQVRVHGGVTYYCGEIELNLSTDYNGSIQVISNDLNIIEPTAVTCAEAMSDDNIGNLMKISGVITDVHETAGQVDMIYVDDGSGEEAMLFINGYIQKESHALDGIAVGMMIEGVGIGSRDVDEASGGADGQIGEDIDPSLFLKRLRVRSRDELEIWGAELDTTALEAAIAEAEGLQRNLYTPESLAAVDEALAAAQAVMNDPDKNQRQVTEAYNALRAALDALELKTTHELYAPVTELHDGDVVVIYNPGHERAVRNGNYKDWYVLAAEVAFDENELIQDPAEDLLWTVHVDGEGNYSFTNGENAITMWKSGTYAELTNNAGIEGGDSLWKLTASTSTEGLYYINSKTVVNEDKLGYMECYNKKNADGEYEPFTVGYWSNSPSDKDFGYRFYSQINPGYYPVSAVRDGDEVVIYNPGHERAVKNGNYKDWYVLAGEVAFAPDADMIPEVTEDLIWTVHVDGEGNYSFTNGENAITMWKSGTYAELTNNAGIEGGDSLWKLTASTSTEGLYYINSKTVVNEDKLGYMECYNKKNADGEYEPFMVGYWSNSPTDKDFGFRFYKFGYGPETEAAEIPVNTTALEAAIAAALAIDRSLYTADSLAVMDAALAAAQAVMEDPDKTQAQVNEAAAALNAAIAALELLPTEGGFYGNRTVVVGGDKVVIYHPGSGKAMGDTVNNNKIPGVAVTASNGELVPAAGTAICTVVYPEGDTVNFYLRMADGKYLTSAPTGNGMSLETTPNEYSLWYLQVKDADAGTVFVRSTNAAFVSGSTNKPQALEYYNNNFTTYGWADSAAFIFQLYVFIPD